MTGHLLKKCKKNMKNPESRKSASSSCNTTDRKRSRKGENPTCFTLTTPISSESSATKLCNNLACRAALSIHDDFCRRCSCCICRKFDDNKDPSLWLVCESESTQVDSCGLSCHIECAFQKKKLGVVNLGEDMNLDGSYCCDSCGKISGILECWKKQLAVAKETRRVDVLSFRINLSYRLLEGIDKFKELHAIITEAKTKLEAEVGSMNGDSVKMARSIVNRLATGADVQKLCSLAIDKANELIASVSTMSSNVFGDEGNNESPKVHQPPLQVCRELDLMVPDLNEELTPPLESSEDEGNGGLEERAAGPDAAAASPGVEKNGLELAQSNGDVAAVDTLVETHQKRASSAYKETVDSTQITRPLFRLFQACDSLGSNFEDCVKMVWKLETGGHINQEFRLKFLTWFSLRSTEKQRRVVSCFIEVIEDPKSLADQLVDSFGELVSSKKPRNS